MDAHIDYGRRHDPYHDRAIRRLLATADRTIYFSTSMRNCGVALGAPVDRAHVVDKGVDWSRFEPANDRQSLKRKVNLPRVPCC